MHRILTDLSQSNVIKFDRMQKLLKIDEDTLNDKLLDWATDFNFRLEEDKIIINQETVNDFINALDSQFEDWSGKEKNKISKLD